MTRSLVLHRPSPQCSRTSLSSLAKFIVARQHLSLMKFWFLKLVSLFLPQGNRPHLPLSSNLQSGRSSILIALPLHTRRRLLSRVPVLEHLRPWIRQALRNLCQTATPQLRVWVYRKIQRFLDLPANQGVQGVGGTHFKKLWIGVQRHLASSRFAKCTAVRIAK